MYANTANGRGVWSPEFGVTRTTPVCSVELELDNMNLRVLLCGTVYAKELKPDVTVPTGTNIEFPDGSVKLTVPDTGESCVFKRTNSVLQPPPTAKCGK